MNYRCGTRNLKLLTFMNTYSTNLTIYIFSDQNIRLLKYLWNNNARICKRLISLIDCSFIETDLALLRALRELLETAMSFFSGFKIEYLTLQKSLPLIQGLFLWENNEFELMQAFFMLKYMRKSQLLAKNRA